MTVSFPDRQYTPTQQLARAMALGLPASQIPVVSQMSLAVRAAGMSELRVFADYQLALYGFVHFLTPLERARMTREARMMQLRIRASKALYLSSTLDAAVEAFVNGRLHDAVFRHERVMAAATALQPMISGLAGREVQTPGVVALWAAFPALRSRQVEVLRLVAQGLSNEEIARQLYISVDTVKTHLKICKRALLLRGRVSNLALAQWYYLVMQREPDRQKWLKDNTEMVEWFDQLAPNLQKCLRIFSSPHIYPPTNLEIGRYIERSEETVKAYFAAICHGMPQGRRGFVRLRLYIAAMYLLQPLE